MKPDLVAVVANGKKEQVNSSCSVADFLAAHGWKATQVVVEYNGRVLDRAEFGGILLGADDQIEVIVPVAGG